MSKHSPAATIESGSLIRGDFALLNTSIDSLPQSDVDFSRVSAYEYTDAEVPWAYRDYDYVVASVGYWPATGLRCVLSREGEGRLYGPGGKPDHTFQIPGAGVFNDTAIGLGYVNRIRAIGDHLYVCGQSRQVWRFEIDGKHVASGKWHDVAGDMRQAPMPALDVDLEGDELDRWLDEHDAIDLVDINGPAEDDIYVVGDEAWHWNGNAWHQLALPAEAPLHAIEVVSHEVIYLVGQNGTVLTGNARDGFVDLSRPEDHQDFTGAACFEGNLFLAALEGLYHYDANTTRIVPIATGLTPELQDAHQLEAKDGILWSFGFKDLAWFDGKRWTRVDHPDNPPIK
ncbi:hypothetical protein FXN63_15560 [Pigmentiphaga aceris]|uniref:Uncharacterized protein n=1 Tax=Pigmentiphaga aceris TaxID=1940612 RepID=A0A5C0B3F4_9BURK|nr:hypothetical protein [Pigmentiphaga aceris]QEI07097.1 hypothetical protein FXN63_15560 [Pigmentiphaga aceris]